MGSPNGRLFSGLLGVFVGAQSNAKRFCQVVALGGILAAPLGAVPADAGPWLEQLRNGSAVQRERAQRWLGLHLTLTDYPALAAGAREADAETGRRLALALASEPAHLGLALLLANEDQDSIASIGRAAFEDLVTRWCPSSTGRPAGPRAVGTALEKQMPQVFVYDGGTETIELHVSRIDRHGQIGVPVVVDPAAGERVVSVAEHEGRGLALLNHVTHGNRLAYSGIGDWDGEMPGQNAWMLVTAASGARSKTGAQRLLAWFQTVQFGGEGAAAAARALGTCGWPAALQWLDRRWTERGDSHALQGILAAASRGRASRSMWRMQDRKRLLGMADHELTAAAREKDPLKRAASQRSAEFFARALVGAGGLGFGGEESSAAWIAQWAGLGARQRWLRLVLLEGQRCGAARARDFLVGELKKESAFGPAIRFQALRALAANPTHGDPSLRIAGLKPLVSWALKYGLGPELTRLLYSLGISPDASELGTDPRSRIFLLGLACLARDQSEAVEQCLFLGKTKSARITQAWQSALESLRLSCGPGWMSEMAVAALGRAKSWPENELARIERVFLMAGVHALPVDNRAWLKNATPETVTTTGYGRLGAWAGKPEGSLELQFLVNAVRTPPAAAAKRAALVAALGLAVKRLSEAHEDSLVARLKQSVWEASANPRSPLHDVLSSDRWPDSYPSLVIDLVGLERLVPGGQ